MKLKIIKQDNKILLIRLSFKLKVGSIKIHLILRDYREELHNHPWDFKSLLILPYKETASIKNSEDSEYDMNKILKLFSMGSDITIDYETQGIIIATIDHKPLALITRDKDILHRTKLYKILGIKIPALTIGKYSEKKQLCSFCKDLGYCRTNN